MGYTEDPQSPSKYIRGLGWFGSTTTGSADQIPCFAGAVHLSSPKARTAQARVNATAAIAAILLMNLVILFSCANGMACSRAVHMTNGALNRNHGTTIF